MKIGELPEVTSPTGAYKIAAEDTNGSAKRTTLLNAIKNVLGSIGCSSYNTVASIFSTYGTDIYTNVTINSATLNGWGKVRELILTVTLNADVTIATDGTPSVGGYSAINCGILKTGFMPKTSPIYGVVYGSHLFGVCRINSSGQVQVEGMNSRPSSYTIASGTSLSLQFHYLSEGAM